MNSAKSKDIIKEIPPYQIILLMIIMSFMVFIIGWGIIYEQTGVVPFTIKEDTLKTNLKPK